MITVFWTRSDADNAQRSASHTDPLRAARTMGATEMYENLSPTGWTWETTEERDRVLSIRSGRDYGIRGGAGPAAPHTQSPPVVYVEHLVPTGDDWCDWSDKPLQDSHPDRKRCPAGCLDNTPRELIDD